MTIRLKTFLPFIFLIAACGTSKKTQKDAPVVQLDDVEVKAYKEYRPTFTLVNDLLHTSLNVSFDWEKQRMNGNAVLTLKPYVKPVSRLELDAKGFDILKIEKIEGNSRTPLKYDYDSLKLDIDLGRVYTEKDTYRIQIDYIAKPNELKQGGSAAITADKGLYFINPDGKEKGKPMQIWTQGETEASSCWFPTIDKPNEKTTEEIYITVPDSLVTLSNGVLAKSTKNADGTRTDYWKMDLPHSPYLFMMAVSNFVVVKDKWRNIDVDYYMEKGHEQDARAIYGNTPEMIEFYSKTLSYDYPWQKYAQVAVRDYVSGAMENTTATLLFENMLMSKRELMDGNYEDIIAHELFHQWFGDLVTCESWSNITLNEGFATYSEYMWAEHKYGKDEAERQRNDMLAQYLGEARRYKRAIVDFYYDDREDMFDAHSYSKGGLVLYMLRSYLGDTIFYKALGQYLHEHAFQNVEIHDLRMAFEKASGEDLNWFFNQWFLEEGHPKLEVSYTYAETELKISVTIEQTQDSESPVFRLPFAIDLYAGGKVQREHVVLEKKKQTFDFLVSSKPDLVNVDGDKSLVCVMNDYKSVDEFAFQYAHATGYMNKEEALTELASEQDNAVATKTLINALQDPFWGVRRLAAESINVTDETKSAVIKAATTDVNPRVRAAALGKLTETSKAEYIDIYKKALADSSLQVISTALDGIYEIDTNAALQLAKQYEEFNAIALVATVANIYAEKGGEDKQAYFEQKAYSTTSYGRLALLRSYGEFLEKRNEKAIRQGAITLEDIGLHSSSSWERFIAANALLDIKKNLDGMLESKEKTEVSEQAIPALIVELQASLAKIIAAEKDPMLLKRYKNFK